jgi:spore germination protein PE
MIRSSSVGQIKINDVSLASVIQIGDNESIKPTSKALAIQREIADFRGNEGDFNDFPLFSRVIPIPEVYEEVHMFVENTYDKIEVGRIRVSAFSSSAVLQIGSNRRIESEARIKHIRQFIKK